MWIERAEEEGLLRRYFAGAGPALALVRGPAGTGRSALVRRALPAHRTCWFGAVPLDAATQWRLLRQAWLPDDGPSAADEDEATLPLPDRLALERRPVTLVLDDVEHLADPGAVALALDRLWHAVRARGLPLHLVLVGTDDGLARLVRGMEGAGDVAALDLTVSPLSAQAVAAALPGWPARDRLQAWAAFGGLPSHLRHLDPGVRLSTNVQRTLLEPGAPLHDEGPAVLARIFQKPERYAALVLALGEGAREWGALRDAVADFTSSSQLAPYLASLEAHGLVVAERSLDARPRSRSRRYRLADPFPGSWYHLVLPHRGRLATGEVGEVWRDAVRPGLDEWARSLLPVACQDYLRRPEGGALPAPAREAGALWGDGYDLPVAGTLRTGAPLYGTCVWGRTATPADAEALAGAVRTTRYGFGREARLRVVFAAAGVDHALRRLEARDPLLRVVTLETVLGM